MTCSVVDADGRRAIVCGSKPRAGARSCQYCVNQHTRLCDWRLRPGVTCDAPLCNEHTAKPEADPDKDLCPRHAAAWEAQGGTVLRIEPTKEAPKINKRPAPKGQRALL